jgi:hypothetical protein
MSVFFVTWQETNEVTEREKFHLDETFAYTILKVHCAYVSMLSFVKTSKITKVRPSVRVYN